MKNAMISTFLRRHNAKNSYKPFILFFIVIWNQITCYEDGWLQKFDTDKIVGGVEADIQQYPWLAQILLLKEHHCGGVIVSSRVIVTAAHCLCHGDVLVPSKFYHVRVGSSESKQGTRYKPCLLRHHPEYMHSKYDYFYDIGLMLLRKNLVLSDTVQIAKIVPHDLWKRNDTTVVVAGYGVLDMDRTSSKGLQMTTMRFVDSVTCNNTPTNDNLPMPVPDHMFCLVGESPTSDCFGDSGSGVMWQDYVVGLVDLGRDEDCGSLNFPSMYVDLRYFTDWIMNNVNHFEQLTEGKCEITPQFTQALVTTTTNTDNGVSIAPIQAASEKSRRELLLKYLKQLKNKMSWYSGWYL